MEPEVKKGFFSSDPESPSMGRLLSFIVTLSGVLIFAIAACLAIYKGQDMGSNIVNGCIWMAGAGVVGKGLQKAAENMGSK